MKRALVARAFGYSSGISILRRRATDGFSDLDFQCYTGLLVMIFQ